MEIKNTITGTFGVGSKIVIYAPLSIIKKGQNSKCCN